MDLSVIILNYNTREHLRRCLSSIRQAASQSRIETIVADNGSTDGSLDMVRSDFPEVTVVENGANLGFAKGNNAAIPRTQGRHVLLLNSDTEVHAGAFDRTVEYLDAHPEAGAVGAKVLLPDGSLDKACRRRFPNPANSFLRLFGLRRYSNYNVEGDPDREAEVDAVMGAYMAVPRAVIDRVGLLDEAYFMYGEDLDWCWRIKAAGYKVVYFPKSVITHYKYGSSKNIPFRVIRWAHDAMAIFYRKHYAARYPAPFNWLVYLGIRARMLLVMLVNLLRRNKSVH